MDTCFIDRDGNEIHMDGVESHIGLANEIIKNDPKLNDEFINSYRKDMVDFLIYEKGFIKLSNQMYYRRCVFLSSKISPKQRKILRFFAEDGYELDDLRIRELEQKAQQGTER